MEVRKVTGKEAEKLTLNFEITREMFEASLPQFDELMLKDGCPPELLTSSKSQVKRDKSKGLTLEPQG